MSLTLLFRLSSKEIYMQKYSLFSLARNALTGHKNWQKAWRSPPLRDEYEIIIIGEVGINHNGSVILAKELINQAVKSGCENGDGFCSGPPTQPGYAHANPYVLMFGFRFFASTKISHSYPRS